MEGVICKKEGKWGHPVKLCRGREFLFSVHDGKPLEGFQQACITSCFKGDFSKLTVTALLGMDNGAAARGHVGRLGRRLGRDLSERPWPWGPGRQWKRRREVNTRAISAIALTGLAGGVDVGNEEERRVKLSPSPGLERLGGWRYRLLSWGSGFAVGRESAVRVLWGMMFPGASGH